MKQHDTTLSVKLPEELASEIADAAARRGRSRSSLVREALTAYLGGSGEEPPERSFLAAAADLAGVLDGDADLSTDPRRLDGYGR